jgi:periplasmic protein TonB
MGIDTASRRRASRTLTLRALGLSLALHVAAAATYGSYQLSSFAPPRAEDESWVAVSIRLQAGGGGEGAPSAAGSPGAPGEEGAAQDPGDEPTAEPPEAAARMSEPVPPSEPVAPIEVASPSEAPPVAAVAAWPPLLVLAPALESAAVTVADRVETLVEATIDGLRSGAPAAATTGVAAPEFAGAQGAGGGNTAADAGSGGDDGSVVGAHGSGGHGDADGRGHGAGGLIGPGSDGGNIPPEYPPDARLAGQQGRVIVLASCSATGAVEAVALAQSSGFPLLDEAALEAVRHWTFAPATLDGVAVASFVRVPVDFVLRH